MLGVCNTNTRILPGLKVRRLRHDRYSASLIHLSVSDTWTLADPDQTDSRVAQANDQGQLARDANLDVGPASDPSLDDDARLLSVSEIEQMTMYNPRKTIIIRL